MGRAMNMGSSFEEIARRSLAELEKHIVPRVPKPEVVPAGIKAGRAGMSGSSAHVGQDGNWEGKEASGLTQDARQVMERIILYPEELIEERAAALFMDRNREWRARNFIGKFGLLQLAGKVGKWEFFEPTAKGLEWAKAREIERAAFKSGVMHEVIVRRVTRAIGKAIEGVKLLRAGAINGVQPDIFLLLPEGGRIPIQVSVKNTPGYEAKAILRLSGESFIERVLLIAINKKKAEQVSLALEGEVSSSSRPIVRSLSPPSEKTEKLSLIQLGKVFIGEAESFLREEFNWNIFLGNGLFQG